MQRGARNCRSGKNICQRLSLLDMSAMGRRPTDGRRKHAPPQLTGEEHVHVYESSEWAERGFCRRCGTHLFYRLKHGDFHAVPVGLFDDPDDWTFALQVFIEEKPAFYCFANDTRTLTGEELIVQFGSE